MRGTLPVPENTINRTLPHLISDVPEVREMEVRIFDDFFELHLMPATYIAVRAIARFRFVEVDISQKRQVIVLQRISRTRLHRKDLLSPMVGLFGEVFFSSILGTDAAEWRFGDLPQVHVEGDLFTIDLSEVTADDVLRHAPQAKWLLKYMRVKEIRCLPQQYHVKLGLQW